MRKTKNLTLKYLTNMYYNKYKTDIYVKLNKLKYETLITDLNLNSEKEFCKQCLVNACCNNKENCSIIIAQKAVKKAKNLNINIHDYFIYYDKNGYKRNRIEEKAKNIINTLKNKYKNKYKNRQHLYKFLLEHINNNTISNL